MDAHIELTYVAIRHMAVNSNISDADVEEIRQDLALALQRPRYSHLSENEVACVMNHKLHRSLFGPSVPFPGNMKHYPAMRDMHAEPPGYQGMKRSQRTSAEEEETDTQNRSANKKQKVASETSMAKSSSSADLESSDIEMPPLPSSPATCSEKSSEDETAVYVEDKKITEERKMIEETKKDGMTRVLTEYYNEINRLNESRSNYNEWSASKDQFLDKLRPIKDVEQRYKYANILEISGEERDSFKVKDLEVVGVNLGVHFFIEEISDEELEIYAEPRDVAALMTDANGLKKAKKLLIRASDMINFWIWRANFWGDGKDYLSFLKDSYDMFQDENSEDVGFWHTFRN